MGASDSQALDITLHTIHIWDGHTAQIICGVV